MGLLRKELIQICNEPFGIDYNPFVCGRGDADGLSMVYRMTMENIEVRKKYKDIINK